MLPHHHRHHSRVRPLLLISASRILLLLVTFLTLLILTSTLTHAYPNGAPEAACATQLPQHDANGHETQPQPGTNGMSITTSTNGKYTSPQPVVITLDAPTQSFKGFMASVYSVLTPQRAGTIQYNDSSYQYVCTTICDNCAITHTSPTLKSQLSFTWYPPTSSGSGDMLIRITIVVTQPIVYVLTGQLTEQVGTQPPATMDAPVLRQVIPTQNTGSDVTIIWTAPTSTGSYPLEEYLLFVKVNQTGDATQIYNGLDEQVVLHGYQPGWVYEFSIQARNTYYTSTASPLALLRPVIYGSPLPLTPTSLAASTQKQPTSINISWSDTKSGAAGTPAAGVQFIGYEVQIKLAPAGDDAYSTVYYGMTPSATIPSLTSATTYSIRVRSFSASGSSSFSTPLVTSTFGSTCSDVGSFTPSGNCRCPTGYLGMECEYSTKFSALSGSKYGAIPCFGGDSEKDLPNGFCFDWIIDDSTLYARLQGRTDSGGSSGWIGLGFGSTVGMLDADMYIFTIPVQDKAEFYHMTSHVDQTQPVILDRTLLPAANYSGFYNKTHFDITMVRALNLTKLGGKNVFDIPSSTSSSTNTSIPISWAVGSSFFTSHSPTSQGRGRALIDFSTQKWSVIETHSPEPEPAKKSPKVSYLFYIPMLVAIGIIIFSGILLNMKNIRHTSLGMCCLRKRPSTLFIATDNKKYHHSSTQGDNEISVSISSEPNSIAIDHNNPISSLASPNGELDDDSNVARGKFTKNSLGKTSSSTLSFAKVFDTLTLDIRSTLKDMTYDQLSTVLVYCVGMLLSVLVGYLTYDPEKTTHIRHIFGHIVAVQLTLVFLPVVRNSIWLYLLGISYERAIRYHRYLVRILLIFTLVHGITMAQWYGWNVLWARVDTDFGNGVLWGSLSFVGMCLMAITAFEPIRRKAWKLFLVSHLLLFPAVIVLVCLHNFQIRYYLIFPLLLYVIDRVIRFRQQVWQDVRVGSVKVIDVTRKRGKRSKKTPTNRRLVTFTLTLPSSPLNYKAGDCCFLTFPELSHFAHPFSISSSPEVDYGQSRDSSGSTLTFHVLEMGEGTFTGRLVEYLQKKVLIIDDGSRKDGMMTENPALLMMQQQAAAGALGEETSPSSSGANSPASLTESSHTMQQQQQRMNSSALSSIPVQLEGTYGSLSVPPEDYTTVVLVAGGIGITPLYSLLSSLLTRSSSTTPSLLPLKQLHLIWVTHTPTAFTEWFPELKGKLEKKYKEVLRLHLYCTQREESSTKASSAAQRQQAQQQQQEAQLRKKSSAGATRLDEEDLSHVAVPAAALPATTAPGTSSSSPVMEHRSSVFSIAPPSGQQPQYQQQHNRHDSMQSILAPPSAAHSRHGSMVSMIAPPSGIGMPHDYNYDRRNSALSILAPSGMKSEHTSPEPAWRNLASGAGAGVGGASGVDPTSLPTSAAHSRVGSTEFYDPLMGSAAASRRSSVVTESQQAAATAPVGTAVTVSHRRNQSSLGGVTEESTHAVNITSSTPTISAMTAPRFHHHTQDSQVGRGSISFLDVDHHHVDHAGRERNSSMQEKKIEEDGGNEEEEGSGSDDEKQAIVDSSSGHPISSPSAPLPPPPPPSPPEVSSPLEEDLIQDEARYAHMKYHVVEGKDGSTAGGGGGSQHPPHSVPIHYGRPPIGLLFSHITQEATLLRNAAAAAAQPHHRGGGGALNPRLTRTSSTLPQINADNNNSSFSSSASFSSSSFSRHLPPDDAVAVYTCGPRELMAEVQKQAMSRGWHLHKETFTL